MSGLGHALWFSGRRSAVGLQQASPRKVASGPFNVERKYLGTYGIVDRYATGFIIGPLVGPENYSPVILEAVVNHPSDPLGLKLGPNFQADSVDQFDALYVRWMGTGNNSRSVWDVVMESYQRLFPFNEPEPPVQPKPPVAPPPPPPEPAKLSPPEQRIDELVAWCNQQYPLVKPFLVQALILFRKAVGK